LIQGPAVFVPAFGILFESDTRRCRHCVLPLSDHTRQSFRAFVVWREMESKLRVFPRARPVQRRCAQESKQVRLHIVTSLFRPHCLITTKTRRHKEKGSPLCLGAFVVIAGCYGDI
jgi:hypothetical protein